MDNTREVLNECIEIKKAKKEYNQAIKNKFKSAWIELVKEEGFSESAIEYLYNCYVTVSGEILCEYFISLLEEDRKECLKMLYQSGLFIQKKDISFKFLLIMLAEFINHNNVQPESIKSLIIRIPSISTNKTGKIIGNAGQILAKQLFGQINSETAFDFKSLEMDPVTERNFANMLQDSLEQINIGELSRKEQEGLVFFTRYFGKTVSEKEANENVCAPDESKLEKQPLIINETHDFNKSPEVTIAPAAETKNMGKENDKTGTVLLKMEQVCSKIDQYVSESDRKQAEILNKVNAFNTSLSHLESENDSLRTQNLIYFQKNEELGKQIESLQNTIGRQKEDLGKMQEMIEIIKMNEEKKSSELLQRISARLKIEYEDYMDAEGLPMSIDLGENLKLQLAGIFDILKKAGIKLD